MTSRVHIVQETTWADARGVVLASQRVAYGRRRGGPGPQRFGRSSLLRRPRVLRQLKYPDMRPAATRWPAPPPRPTACHGCGGELDGGPSDVVTPEGPVWHDDCWDDALDHAGYYG